MLKERLFTIYNFIELNQVHNITLSGKGKIDGQGFMWWVREISRIFDLKGNPHGRPNMIEISNSTGIEWTGIKLINSPYYHINARDIDGGYFHDFEIYVDIMSQNHLSEFLGLGLRIPTFPLNTDGIDPAGTNILIERVNITNFDDAVAVKP